MNIVIPMAGLGSRFANSGFDLIKPLIPVANKVMYRHAIDNLPLKLATNLIFIIRKDACFSELLTRSIEENYGLYPYKIIALNHETHGQAETVLMSSGLLDLTLPTLIHNCDTYLLGNINWDQLLSSNADGALLLFKSNENRWSYVLVNESNSKIIDIQEKRVISSDASTGTYYFKNSIELLNNIQKMINQNLRVNNEYYLSTVYSLMLKQGKNILPIWVNKIRCFGTPQDLVMSLNEMLLELLD